MWTVSYIDWCASPRRVMGTSASACDDTQSCDWVRITRERHMAEWRLGHGREQVIVTTSQRPAAVLSNCVNMGCVDCYCMHTLQSASRNTHQYRDQYVQTHARWRLHNNVRSVSWITRSMRYLRSSRKLHGLHGWSLVIGNTTDLPVYMKWVSG